MCEFKFWLFSVYPLADGAVPQNASFVVLLPPLLKLSNRERRGAEKIAGVGIAAAIGAAKADVGRLGGRIDRYSEYWFKAESNWRAVMAVVRTDMVKSLSLPRAPRCPSRPR